MAHATGPVLFPALEPGAASDRLAVRAGGTELTYAELARDAAAVAHAVHGLDCVALVATPDVATVSSVVGALLAGVPIVPLNAKAGQRELEHVLADSRPGGLLAAGGQVPAGPLEALPLLVPERAAGAYAPPPTGDEDPPGACAPSPTDGEQTGIVLYTSGTTGLPKGVLIPRRAIAANLDALAAAWEWTAADTLVHALPLFHVHGLVLGILGPLRLGGAVVHVGRFSPEATAAALDDGGTMLFGVPTMYHRLADAAEEDPALARSLGRARLLVSGSAALPAVDHQRIERLTGQRVAERYGMTETLIITGVRASGDRRPSYVGPALDGVALRLVDDEGAPLPVADDETIGEVQVRGDGLFTGYLNRPDATAEAFRDGWFATGDLATLAPDGYLRIVGRRSTDLIKSGGYKIGAGEIEGALLEHPQVAEAAVTGAPDPDLGEHVVAWIVPRPGTAPTAAELADHVGRLLSSHKRPRVVHLLPELPRNAMGKVVKQQLQAP